MKVKLVTVLGLTILVVFVLFMVKMLGLSVPLTVYNSTVSSELSVVGEGKIDVTPDVALVNVGIWVQKEQSPQVVKTKLDGVNDAIIASMKKIGVKSADIKTTNYSINPSYDDRGENINGYSGSASVDIKVRDTSMASKVISEATAAGANQVNSTQFTVENPEKYREMARAKAIANAKDQATKLSQELGLKLGRITNLVESAPSGVTQPYMYDLAAKSSVGGAGFEQGSQTISSTVTVFFEKK